MPQVIYKPHCHYQNSSLLANGVYFIAIINKTPLRNGNCPIMNLIIEIGVSHTVGQVLLLFRPKYGGEMTNAPCSSRGSDGPGGKVAKCTCSLPVPMFSIGVVIEIRIISI